MIPILSLAILLILIIIIYIDQTNTDQLMSITHTGGHNTTHPTTHSTTDIPILHIREPWLELIRTGKKTVEGRPGPKSKFSRWIGKDLKLISGKQEVIVSVIDVHHYDDLNSYLDGEGWEKVAPHLKSREETLQAYHQFYTDNDIKTRGGMNGIVLKGHAAPRD